MDELALELDLTDNAVRPHLTALERDGMVRAAGVRRREGAGQPAVLYELHPDAEPLLSKAYAPVLAALVDVIGETLPERDARRILRRTGLRLAESLGGRAPGDLRARANAAAEVLTALGGTVEVGGSRGTATIRGSACPLASAVSRNASVCHAVETLVGEIAGAKATECCDRSERPRCCFELRPAS